MLRVSAVAERAGFPSSSLVCEGFVGQAGTTSVGLGLPNLPVASVPGHVDMQTDNELRDNVLGTTLDQVVANLTEQPEAARSVVEPGPEEIVFEGAFEEVNRLFYENRWSDGLPVVPPTPAKIDEFLAFTALPPDHVLGTAPPDHRAATVRSVAANGVMAGCRPEYMPILVALAEAMTDPAYGVEHSGNTPGSETLVTLNGPIIRELGFNYEQGALRDGFMANTTVGRFWRLYLRNVAGFLPHRTDKGTYGNTWRVVLAENEGVLARIGWEPLASDFGFRSGENVVTISRYTGGDVVTSVYGQTPERMLPYLGDALVKQSGWQLVFTVGMARGTYRPLLLLTPILAETIAKGGWSRGDLKCWLFDHARLPASKFEAYMGEYTNLVPGRRTLRELVEAGKAPPVFAGSDDPERMVPVVCEPEDILVAVTGDPLRTNAYVFSHNGMLGYPVAKRVELPDGWEGRLREARSR